MTFTLKFPMKIGPSGQFETDKTPMSQVVAFLECPKNGKLGVPAYGSPLQAFEQEPLSQDLQNTIVVVETHEGLEQFVPDAQTLGVTLVPSTTNDYRGQAEIIFMDRAELTVEPYKTKLGMGIVS